MKKAHWENNFAKSYDNCETLLAVSLSFFKGLFCLMFDATTIAVHLGPPQKYC